MVRTRMGAKAMSAAVTKAMALPEHEYWIAGAHKELQSLKDLQVFILVPRSSMPKGRCPLKGKLVCKCNATIWER